MICLNLLIEPLKSQAYISLQSLLCIPESLLNKFSEIVYNLFTEDKLNDATDGFFLLSILEPANFDHWLSLGICEQKRENFENAIKAYKMSSLSDSKNPIPHLHQAQCYANLEKVPLAKQTAEHALALIRGKKEHW